MFFIFLMFFKLLLGIIILYFFFKLKINFVSDKELIFNFWKVDLGFILILVSF